MYQSRRRWRCQAVRRNQRFCGASGSSDGYVASQRRREPLQLRFWNTSRAKPSWSCGQTTNSHQKACFAFSVLLPVCIVRVLRRSTVAVAAIMDSLQGVVVHRDIKPENVMVRQRALQNIDSVTPRDVVVSHFKYVSFVLKKSFCSWWISGLHASLVAQLSRHRRPQLDQLVLWPRSASLAKIRR